MATNTMSLVHNQDAGDEPIADDILRAIRRILRKTAEHSRHTAREGGLSVPQLLCLRRIAEATTEQPITVAQVALAVQLTSAAVSRMLDRLEAEGLIARERSTSDRRKVFLRITPRGSQRIEHAPVPLQDQFLAELFRLGRQEQRALRDSLEQIVRMMGAEEMDVSPLLLPDSNVGVEGNAFMVDE